MRRKCPPADRAAPTGFTLVEMLVALSLFAAIAAMGVTLLRSSVDTHDAVQLRLKAMGSINRLRAVMANDLAQAVPRATRDVTGSTVPAFSGGPTSFSLVHAGALIQPDVPRGRLERIVYNLDGDEWLRAVQPMLDGVAPAAGDRLAGDVQSVALRYRDALGNWNDNWTSDPGNRLPLAVEMRFQRQGREPLTLMFLGTPTAPPPAEPASAP